MTSQLFSFYGKLIAATALILCSCVALAQDTLHYVKAMDFVFLGKPKVTDQLFHRIDTKETKGMTKAVQGLSKNSAGISLIFESNSPVIAVKWELAENKVMANMTPIAHSGLDLYAYKNRKWQYVNAGKPMKDSLNQTQVIIQNMDTTVKQFMLYLPLYNSINALSIGVSKNAKISPPSKVNIKQSKRVVIYGSSIVQGASASRPGLAYPAILQRKLGMDVINLGFSGSAKMEIEVAEYLATLQADCYVLDCIPNQTAAQIKARALPFIKYLRSQKPNTPIILVESVVREHGFFDQKVDMEVVAQNNAIREAYNQLKKEHYKNIFYVPATDFMGNDHEGTIDGVHLTDVGFSRIADAIMKVIKRCL